MADEHDHEHGHSHGDLKFIGVDVADATLETLRSDRPELARNLELSRRFSDLLTEEKAELLITQTQIEQSSSWVPGYHSEGDKCVSCGKPTVPLFGDRFETGELAYAAFLGGLPVHPTSACVEIAPRGLAPNKLDQARRGVMRDLTRPSPGMTQFFRHDVLSHPPFGLEHWADSVAEANPKGLDKQTMKDMDRLLQWVHARFFH